MRMPKRLASRSGVALSRSSVAGVLFLTLEGDRSMAVRKNALARIITNAATAPALALSADLPFGVQDDAYTGRVVASGGVGSYSYTVDSKPSWITATQV